MSKINLNLNPFQSSFPSKKYERCIYFSPEDITDKLSGGHIEILSDIYFLSKIFNRVEVVYPFKNKKKVKNNLRDNILKECLNIKEVPITTNKSLLGFLFISRNRIDTREYFRKNKIHLNDLLLVSCHRNILIHLIIFFRYGSKNLVFKSHGSIIKHNLDNILSCLRLKYPDKFILKRLISFLFYIFFENLSFLISKKVFFMRAKKNIRNIFYVFLLRYKLDSNLKFNCASSLFFLNLKRNFNKYPLKIKSNLKKKKLIFGSLADNTFPCNLLGLKIIINNLHEFNKQYGFDIHIRIGGKINREVMKIIKESFLIKNDNLEVLGYVENLNVFYENLDALLVASAGGSGIPIKIFQSSLDFPGPILASNYIQESAGELINFNKNIFFDTKLFFNYFDT